MIELILAIFVIPKTISPIAKESGRSGIRWTFICITVFWAVEIGIASSYFFIYNLLAIFYRLKQAPPQYWLAPFVYIIAMVCGLLSVDIIRRRLSREILPKDFDPPPPPPIF